MPKKRDGLGRYVLDGNGEPVRVDDFLEWAKWLAAHERIHRHVRYTQISADIYVSTMFIGIDHGWWSPKPVLWETMIFGGPNDLYCDRYTSREDAIRGHEKAVRLASTGIRGIVNGTE